MHAAENLDEFDSAGREDWRIYLFAAALCNTVEWLHKSTHYFILARTCIEKSILIVLQCYSTEL